MPSLIDLRRRIRAVKSTEQITKAMKTVAASNCDASTSLMNARSGTPGRAPASRQFAPPSSVAWMRPSSLPV